MRDRVVSDLPPSVDVELSSLIGRVGKSSIYYLDSTDDDGVDANDKVTLPAAPGLFTTLPPRLVLFVWVVTFLGSLLIAASFAWTRTSIHDGNTTSEKATSEYADVDVPHSPGFPDPSTWMKLRWQPGGEPDNCYDRFRLANATIYCGAGSYEPITTDDDGNRYCGGVPMKPNLCVLPISGKWILPTTTTHLSPLDGRFGINQDSNNTDKPLCRTMKQLVDGTHDESGNWIPNSFCTLVPLSPFSWTERSPCQTTIVMMGDSHVRNLFTATVNGLRGVSYFTEAHADDAMKSRGVAESYQWVLNNEGVASDRIGIFSDTKENPPQFFDECSCRQVLRCLNILFLWAPTFNEQMIQFHLVPSNTALLIVEPGNAYEPTNKLDADWTEKIDDMMEEYPRLHLNTFHFVWGNQPQERTQALIEWTAHGKHAERKSYLRQDEIYVANGLQGRATFHFACGLGQKDTWSDTITAAEPCSDVTDTSQIRAIVTAHFDALEGIE